jgi:uncharacterized repeat protein (TIGR03803 family)
MSLKKHPPLLLAGCIVVFRLLAITNPAFAASKEKVLYSFAGYPNDGASPASSLIFDAAGNLYGTTARGGTFDKGAVFQLSPGAGGTWTESVLYSFGDGTDGATPASGLIFDAAGNLYGTTEQGGTSTGSCGGGGCGTVFQLSPGAGGTWTESVLYSFGGGTDGAVPFAGLIFDAAGNLYGTTYIGGNSTDCYIHGCGTVFQLSPGAGGTWTENVLYKFCSADGCTDGSAPEAGLIFDTAGNLYGTTSWGGDSNLCGGIGCGLVFQLSPGTGGAWTETVLHTFHYRRAHNNDGATPYGAEVIFDAAGNLYGTTYAGGANGTGSCGGTVFRLMPAGGGKWKEKVLYSFCIHGNNDRCKYGCHPQAGLILDKAGNLYGTTADGPNGGTAFELQPEKNSKWLWKALYMFCHQNGCKDGSTPEASLVFDPAGNLYGTTYAGGGGCPGNGGCGTVFEVKP